MAANPSVDLTEEDAADLQFPKDLIKSRVYSLSDTCSQVSSNSNTEVCDICENVCVQCSCDKCGICNESLRVPFIECTQCENLNLCCKCFANGREIGRHESDHSYRVLNHDFTLFTGSDWTAAEELTMLDLMYTYGYGVWETVAKNMRNRSEREIKEHYDRFYLNHPASDLLPKIESTAESLFPTILVPYRYRLNDIEEPPRYAVDTLGYESIAGYNAARSDFNVEYDAHAEDLLANLNDNNDTDDVTLELKCAIVRSYNRRLRERARRKQIVHEHGLILTRKTMSWLHRYDATLTRNTTERMIVFMQFYSGTGFDELMEGLHRAAELKLKISRLLEYHRKGITTLEAAEIYENLKEDRLQQKKELNQFLANPVLNWKKIRQSVFMSAPNLPNRRIPSRPLDIVGLPGFEKLSVKEKDLCSSVRLVPLTYFELRDALIAENQKLGYVSLKVARRMFKIDVNKTRKLYDFLVSEGYISRPRN